MPLLSAQWWISPVRSNCLCCDLTTDLIDTENKKDDQIISVNSDELDETCLTYPPVAGRLPVACSNAFLLGHFLYCLPGLHCEKGEARGNKD